MVCPVAGCIADYFTSRRTTFVIAFFALIGSTVLLCIGSSIGILILGRILQGISSALTWTAGLTLVVETVEKREVGIAMGVCSLGVSLALLLAPLVGGLLFEHSGYYSVFGLTFGVLFLDIIWRLAIIEKDAAARWISTHVEEYWTLRYGVDGTPSIHPSPARTEIMDLEAFFLDYQIEDQTLGENQHSRRHFIGILQNLSQRITVLLSRRLQVALVANLAQISVIASFDAVLPQFVQRTFSWGPEQAGLVFIPIVAPYFLSVYLGRLTDKYGPKWFVGTGFTVAIPALVLLRLITSDEVGHVVLLCALLALLSSAMAFVGTPLMAEIVLAVEAMERSYSGIFGHRGPIAQAYALYSVSVFGGLLVGPLWGGVIAKAAGWNTMTCTFGLLSGLMAILTYLFTGGTLNLRKFCR